MHIRNEGGGGGGGVLVKVIPAHRCHIVFVTLRREKNKCFNTFGHLKIAPFFSALSNWTLAFSRCKQELPP